MTIKRFHNTLASARAYVESMPERSLRIWPIKKKNRDTGRLNTTRYWVGTEFEWLNRY